METKPDGLKLYIWQSGKLLCCDVTVTCPLAESRVTESAREAGAAAELAASRNEDASIGSHLSVPLCTHRGRNLGPSEHVSLPTLC